MKSELLKTLKRHPGKQIPFKGTIVRIYSEEHGAYWKAGQSGYTEWLEKAGHYPFSEAWRVSSHCGPEKGIRYEIVEE